MQIEIWMKGGSSLPGSDVMRRRERSYDKGQFRRDAIPPRSKDSHSLQW